MISFLLRTAGSVLISAAVNNEKFQKKVFGVFKRTPSKFVRVDRWVEENKLFDQQIQTLNLRLNDLEYMNSPIDVSRPHDSLAIDMSKAVFPNNEEIGSEPSTRRNRTDVSPEDYDPETGEILEGSPGKKQ